MPGIQVIMMRIKQIVPYKETALASNLNINDIVFSIFFSSYCYAVQTSFIIFISFKIFIVSSEEETVSCGFA